MSMALGKGCPAAGIVRAAGALSKAGHPDRSAPEGALVVLSSRDQREVLRGIPDMRRVRMGVGYTETLLERPAGDPAAPDDAQAAAAGSTSAELMPNRSKGDLL